MGERELAAASGYCRTRTAQVYEGKRDGRLLGRAGERKRDGLDGTGFLRVWKSAYIDTKRINWVKKSEFHWLKWSYFLLAQNSDINGPKKLTLSMLAEILRRAGEREFKMADEKVNFFTS